MCQTHTKLLEGCRQDTKFMMFSYAYPHPAVAVDVVVFGIVSDRLAVLLIRRGEEPFSDAWALPGGFVRADETVHAAVTRVLREETGLSDQRVVMYSVFSEPDRDPRERVISLAHLTCVHAGNLHPVAGSDAAALAWWALGALPKLAFDHDRILQAGLDHLRKLVDVEPIAARLLADRFKLSDLQRATELILGRPLDKRNFRRKVEERNWLQETADIERGRHRPAQLFTLRSDPT